MHRRGAGCVPGSFAGADETEEVKKKADNILFREDCRLFYDLQVDNRQYLDFQQKIIYNPLINADKGVYKFLCLRFFI